MDLPTAEIDTTRHQDASENMKSRNSQKRWELYLNKHPFPTWDQVAKALYYSLTSLKNWKRFSGSTSKVGECVYRSSMVNLT